MPKKLKTKEDNGKRSIISPRYDEINIPEYERVKSVKIKRGFLGTKIEVEYYKKNAKKITKNNI